MLVWATLAMATEPPQVVNTEAQRQAAQQTIVHEWGTFTSAHAPDGTALRWRVLGGSEPLPAFVHEAGEPGAVRDRVERVEQTPCDRKDDCWAMVRMETPVLYFHAPASARFRVQVQFPEGQLTEWYPAVRTATPDALDWGWVSIEPGLQATLPTDAGGSHYYEARDVDAAVVRADDEVERFLFYRGVGGFEPAVRPVSTAREVSWDGHGAASLIVFENAERRVGAARLDAAGKVRRGALRGADPRPLLRQALLDQGLFADEVSAMLATWDADWFGPGLRAFYVVPTAEVDERLPLTLEPAPAARVRVLVGRAELLAPDRVQAAHDLTAALPEDARAEALVSAFGRVGEPLGILAQEHRITSRGGRTPGSRPAR